MAWLYKQKGSQNWWLGWRVNGKSFFKTTGTPDRAEAEKALAQYDTMKAAQRAGTLTEALFRSLTGAAVTNGAALKPELERWLAERKNTSAADTYTRYKVVADRFAAFLKASDIKPALAEVTSRELFAYLSQQSGIVKASSVNLERKILSGFFNWAVQGKLIAANPVAQVKRFKGKDGNNRRAFTIAEIRDMHAKAPTAFWRYMVMAGFYWGQRLGDLVCIKRGQIDFDGNVVRFRQIKTGATVTTFLRPELRALLLPLCKKLKAGDYLFPDKAELYLASGADPFSAEFAELVLVPCGLYSAKKKKADKVKGRDGRTGQRETKETTFHCIRHTFVSQLKLTGGNQAIAKELAGHSSDLVNDLYTHVPEDALRAAVLALPEVTI